jgi:hypothetical protein
LSSFWRLLRNNYQIEQHVKAGGADRPAELLFSFLFRYGYITHFPKNVDPSMRTLLVKGSVVETSDGGGLIDLAPCYQIQSCASLFGSCWGKLYTLVRRDSFNPSHSMIQYLVDSNKLEVDRAKTKKNIIGRLKSIFGADGFRREMEIQTSRMQQQQSQFARKKEMETNIDSEDQKQSDRGEHMNPTIPGGSPSPLYEFQPCDASTDQNSKKEVDDSKTSTKSRNKIQKNGLRTSREGTMVAVASAEAANTEPEPLQQRRRPPFKRQKTW